MPHSPLHRSLPLKNQGAFTEESQADGSTRRGQRHNVATPGLRVPFTQRASVGCTSRARGNNSGASQ